jgi:hypothetical protein
MWRRYIIIRWYSLSVRIKKASHIHISNKKEPTEDRNKLGVGGGELLERFTAHIKPLLFFFYVGCV